jgi:hypothetical protein
MKVRLCVLPVFVLIVALFAGGSLRAGTPGYAYCGTYGSYVLMYKSNDQLEELGHLRCGEKVEVLSRWLEYVQVRTAEGRIGWVHYSGISNTPAGTSNNFGMTDSSAPRAASVHALTNTNVMKMHVIHLGSDVIIAKIKSSPCEFDTTPGALQKLKTAGVSDKVILAMVQAPSASAPPPEPKHPDFIEVKVPRFTSIEVELTANISSDAAQDGMIVPLKVAQDVVVNGVTVFPKGSQAHASVSTLKQPGFMNRPPGEITWTMDYVTAVSGDHVNAMFLSKEAATNPMSRIMGASGPSWEFRKGKPVSVSAGQRFNVVVHDDAVLRVPATQLPDRPAQAATVPARADQMAGQPSAKP